MIKRKKPKAKKVRKIKLARRKKILVHPVKSRKAGISPKAKLFNRVKKKSKSGRIKKTKKKITKAKKKARLVAKKPKLKKKVVSAKVRKKKFIKKKIKPLKKVLKKKKKRVVKSKKFVSAKISERKRKKNSVKKKLKVKKSVKKKIVVKKQKKQIKRKVKSKKIARKIISKKSKKIAPKPLSEEFSAEPLFKARIKVVGIGGGGGSIVSEIGRSLKKATFVIADTDIRALRKRPGIKYFWFGEELTHGLGTGVNVDLAKHAAEGAKEEISDIFKGQDIVIFIASLGGGLGSGATRVFAETAKEFGGITFGIFTLPFKFEGKNKARIAQNALKSLRQSLNVSLTIPNEKIFKIISADTPITEAFSIVNKSLIESLESLIDLIYNPGIINIDFADLRTILKGRGNSAFLNTVEESGKNRADKICERVFANPLLQNNNFTAEKILFNIAGSDNLSMFEVEKISRHIADLNPKAKIIFGISKNHKLKNKVKTTILMTGGEIKEEIPAQKPEIIVSTVNEPVKETIKKEENELVGKKEIEAQKAKKQPSKKPVKKIKKKGRKIQPSDNGQNPVSFIPVFEVPTPPVPVVDQKKLDIVGTKPVLVKKAIRRSGLEVKKAEEQEEKKRMAQEKEWEIPAFLRRVKFNK